MTRMMASLLWLKRSGRDRCSPVSCSLLQHYCYRYFASSSSTPQHPRVNRSSLVLVGNNTTSTTGSATAATVNNNDTTTITSHQRAFVSSFDADCAIYVSRLLEKFPVTLRHTEQYGMGLYATRDLWPDDQVLFEDPAFPFTSDIMDRLERVVADDTCPGVEITADSLAVAAMVDRAVAETSSSCRPSTFLPIRCLGYVPGQPHDLLEEAFALIGQAYHLPASIWTMEECRLLHDKVTTNMFTMVDTELYIGVSMINHSCCDENVAWSADDPLRSLVASRPIAKGQQLFYNYAADLADPTARHEFLRDTFGFRCTCTACRTAGLVKCT
jgi:hypothetical protein